MKPEDGLLIIGMLTAAYPNVDLGEKTVKLYLQFLADVPYECGQAAALQLISESKWFPSIAELRNAAIAALPGNYLPSSAEAWAEVSQALSKSWLHQAVPHFSHKAVENAVNAIGWQNLWMGDNPAADRAHFMRIYENYAEREKREAAWIPEVWQLMNQLDEVEAAAHKALPEPDEPSKEPFDGTHSSILDT